MRPTLQTWTLAFALEARHSYFSDGRCPSVAFRPVDDTVARLRSVNMLCRETQGGIAVFRTQGPAPTEADATVAVLDLAFRLVVVDPAFVTYTRLDGADSASTLFFDTEQSAAPDADGVRRLHADAHVSVADRRSLDAPELETLVGARDHKAPPLGFVRVRVPLYGTDADVTWTIAFEARTTLWKYYVLGTSDTSPTIRDADGRIEFEPAAATVLPGNRRAVVLRSKVAIPLRERPAQRFQLRVATPAGERVLVKRLALASPRLLGKDTVDGRDVTVSEIYINL